MKTYDQYSDPNCPACDCADWGMMGCLSTCSQDKYIKRKQQEIKMSNKTASDKWIWLPSHQGYSLCYKQEQMVTDGGRTYNRTRWAAVKDITGEDDHVDIHKIMDVLQARGWRIRPTILLEKLLPPPTIFYPRDVMNRNGIAPGNAPREIHLWEVRRLEHWYLEVEAKAKEDARIMIEESQAAAVVEESKADETPAAKDWQEEPPPVRVLEIPEDGFQICMLKTHDNGSFENLFAMEFDKSGKPIYSDPDKVKLVISFIKWLASQN